MDECGEIEYREENLDDQIKIFVLESEFEELRVRIAPSLARPKSANDRRMTS